VSDLLGDGERSVRQNFSSHVHPATCHVRRVVKPDDPAYTHNVYDNWINCDDVGGDVVVVVAVVAIIVVVTMPKITFFTRPIGDPRLNLEYSPAQWSVKTNAKRSSRLGGINHRCKNIFTFFDVFYFANVFIFFKRSLKIPSEITFETTETNWVCMIVFLCARVRISISTYILTYTSRHAWESSSSSSSKNWFRWHNVNH